jgi:hypothetical protein
MEPYIGWGLATLFGALSGYLIGYSKKKGENRAIHEDIDKLVDEVRAVTTTTKQIEAKISDEVWDRQKRWELKRDLLLEAIKRIAVVKDALTSLHVIYLPPKDSSAPESPEHSQKRIRLCAEWIEAANRLDESFFLLEMACGGEVVEVLGDFDLFARHLSAEIIDGRLDAFNTSLKEFTAKLNAVRTAMQKEIGTKRSS